MKVKENPWVLLIVIAVVIVTRLIPHYPNFTALGAAAIFGGACFRKHTAFLIPVAALFISDLILNNLIYARELPGDHGGFIFLQTVSLWTYGAFILIAWIAGRLIRSRRILPVIGTSLVASTLFFLISNFAVWVHSAMYLKTVAGLLTAYGAGLPFFGSTVAGDLFFVAVFFGGLEFVRIYVPGLVKQETP